jgi:large subunit ribosomal protein L10
MMKADKALEIQSLSEKFGKANAAFLVDFKGMTVDQVTVLRKKLHPLDAEMKVVRNTLAIRALIDHPASEAAIASSFVGTNAVVFAYGEAAGSAKALADFGKDVEQFQLKVGASKLWRTCHQKTCFARCFWARSQLHCRSS